MAPKSTLRRSTSSSGYQQTDGKVALLNSIYIGFVKDNSDGLLMGRLRVWIPELASDPTDSNRWFMVNYMSPFAGATPATDNIKGSKVMAGAQQSYGFWMIPPDIDNEVVVAFINGDPNRGVFLGCLYQQFMNHMVPGIPTNTSFDVGDQGIDPPVSDYNKWDGDVNNQSDPVRPRFDPLHTGLLNEGLYPDRQRGPASSGARREVPSHVFGVLTPRGQQWVMDDNPDNEFIRIRTRGGTQLLVHETSGFVYINSKNGNSWMEVSDDGVDVYTAKSLSFRAQADINFHADHDFNVYAQHNVNFYAGASHTVQVGKDLNTLVGGTQKTSVEGSINQTALGGLNLAVTGNTSLLSTGTIALLANGSFGITSTLDVRLQGAQLYQQSGPGPLPFPALPGTGQDLVMKNDRELNVADDYEEIQTNTIVSRLVTHEPFALHPGDVAAPPVTKKVDLSVSQRITVDGNAPIPAPTGSDILPGDAPPDTPVDQIDPNATFVVPVTGTITSPFGPRDTGIPGASRNHLGVDIAAASGTPIIASADGQVTAATSMRGYGNVIFINHANGVQTRYAHQTQFYVKQNDQVKQGQTIGSVGNTGVGSGPHCHFEIRKGGTAVDPASIIPALVGKGTKVRAGTSNH